MAFFKPKHVAYSTFFQLCASDRREKIYLAICNTIGMYWHKIINRVSISDYITCCLGVKFDILT
jgi:hypothetical protein